MVLNGARQRIRKQKDNVSAETVGWWNILWLSQWWLSKTCCVVWSELALRLPDVYTSHVYSSSKQSQLMCTHRVNNATTLFTDTPVFSIWPTHLHQQSKYGKMLHFNTRAVSHDPHMTSDLGHLTIMWQCCLVMWIWCDSSPCAHSLLELLENVGIEMVDLGYV